MRIYANQELLGRTDEKATAAPRCASLRLAAPSSASLRFPVGEQYQ
jgi:hypothetical protein